MREGTAERPSVRHTAVRRLIILAFDLATRSGWCIGRPDATPAVGAVVAPASGVDYGVFGDFYMTFFDAKIYGAILDAENGEEILVVYEAPILPHPRLETDARGKTKLKILTTVQTTRKLGALGVLLEALCLRWSRTTSSPITVRECQVQAIKNELAGHTKADKSEMVYAARRAGIALPPGDDAMDAADAFGAWLIGVRKYAPEHRWRWDQKLFSPGGQLRLTAEQARGLFRGGRR